MHNNNKPGPGNAITCLVVVANAIVLEQGMMSNAGFYWLLILTIPLLVLSLLQRV
jgi:hypothetical protein